MDSNNRHNYRQGQQYPNWDQQLKGEEVSEQSPLILPPYPSRIGKEHTHHHDRTRSDFSHNYISPEPSSSSPRRLAPSRNHHRTRSLEEWANLFGIPGVAENSEDAPRERVLYRRGRPPPRHRANQPKKPPVPPVPHRGHRPPLPPRHSFSPSTPSTRKRKVTLDSITETERPDEENDSDEKGKDSNRDENTRHAYGTNQASERTMAAATVDARSSFHSEDSNSSTKDTHQSRQGRNSGSNQQQYNDDNNQSVGSNGSARFYRIPSHLKDTLQPVQYAIGDSGDESSVGNYKYDSEADENNSTGAASWFSHHSRNHSRSDSFDDAALDRLARFEREQELMFRQKKNAMEQQLSNVLERNAVKSFREKQEFINTYMAELEREREKLVAQWRDEWEKQEEYLRRQDPNRKLLRSLANKIGQALDMFMYCFSTAEVFVSNMPLTIAALALSWVSMGCCWFKFMEENVESCKHVHFYSSQCTFPEFPGCFQCDEENHWYIVALNWHYFCSSVSFTFCAIIMLKVIIAWDVVVDELSNPTTSTPCGVFCIAMVCVFAGRGAVGEMVVLITAGFHFVLAFWFLYMAIYRYRLYPDPGWFPNTVGISFAAVKSFLYFPIFGEILMSLCLTFFFGIFFISAIRVATNPKIAAPICWFMISAPSMTLYAVTLISQPVESEEQIMADNPQMKAHFVSFLHHFYLPLHHFLFGCSLIGVISAIHGVATRWNKFKEKEFSPAHVAFVAPTLAHTNAIQSYRATLAALSSLPPSGWFRKFIYFYWCLFLFSGTIVCFVFTYKFLKRLPEWTRVDVSGEEEPPMPYDTMTHEMLDDRGAHETMFHQTFVSPAVLEANEAGALIRVRRGTEDYRRYGPFIRTRKVTARGFDPSMNDSELREERAAMLDWVAKNAPRKRNRTMSIPGVMHLRDKKGRDVYEGLGSPDDGSDGTIQGRPSKHSRSKTSLDTFW